MLTRGEIQIYIRYHLLSEHLQMCCTYKFWLVSWFYKISSVHRHGTELHPEQF